MATADRDFAFIDSPSQNSPIPGLKFQLTSSKSSPQLLSGQINRVHNNVPESMSFSNSLYMTPPSPDDDRDATVFTDVPNPKLTCRLCKKVFREPVITCCGHTYCKRCVNTRPEDVCPLDNIKLQVVVANLAVSEQIGELYIYCKYGCRLKDDSSGWEVDPRGCPNTMKYAARREHEDECEYQPVKCPNDESCPLILKKDLQEHLNICQNVKCPNNKYGCTFVATRDELPEHLETCKYESIKGFLQSSDDKIADLQLTLSQKDQEICFLRSMLGKVSERLDQLEKNVDEKMDILEKNQNHFVEELMNNTREFGIFQDELANINARLSDGMHVGAFDPQQTFKCKGTFVGHQGPVWCLVVHTVNDLLYTGSTDKTIKVWDLTTKYCCIKTLEGHAGTVLALTISGNKLFSGSQDSTISVWNLETHEKIKDIEAHDNPVCTLCASRNMIFSGSLKVVKVWDSQSHQLIKELSGFEHWVRVIIASQNFLYTGSFETVKIWNLETFECVKTLETIKGSVYSLCLTAHYILCGTNENKIHVWELDTYQPVKILMGHTGVVYAMMSVQTTSGTKVISASHDRSLRVWSMDNMICTQTLVRHQGSVACLGGSRGRLFSGAVDSTVKVWQ